MELKLAISGKNQSWTLKPGRQYTVGTAPTCDLPLDMTSGAAPQHVLFRYDEAEQRWYVRDISQGVGISIDGQPASESPIERYLSINLAPGLVLTTSPHVSTPTLIPVPPTPAPPAFPTTYSGRYNTATPTQPRPTGVYPPPRTGVSEPGLMRWKDYVQYQLDRTNHGIERLALWFHMVTGFRNTPWVKSFHDPDSASSPKANNFNSFEGYIIPNFKGGLDKVVAAVEKEIGTATNYQDTECAVVSLTDAHLVDTANQSFLGVELFPIHRSNQPFPRGDYRRFFVTAYHRVRTYLLIEQYGEDLFVSWITRYEPNPSFTSMILFLILAFFIALPGMITGDMTLFLLPLVIWAEYFLVTPKLMEAFDVLPKAANARLIQLVIIPITFILMLAWIVENSWQQFMW
ncbi:MAG: FHA domain-containing protein [Leptolyngbyaceae bacterium]|nr:FHA domain-containing protein [Leptolyngbyaceae bacterium]